MISPTREAQFFDTAQVLCISYPSQARFRTDRHDLLQQYTQSTAVLLVYSSIACLQHYYYYSNFYTARRELITR